MLSKLPTIDKKILSPENILKKTSEGEIFRHFFGEYTIGKMYKSPLRSNDTSPSFNIYINSNKQLRFKDWGMHGNNSGNCFTFVCLLHKVDYRGALEIISNSMNLGLFKNKKVSGAKKIEYKNYQSIASQPLIIATRVRTRKWEKYDADYWSQYGISPATLQKFGIAGCKELWTRKEGFPWKKIWVNTTTNPIYIYKIKKYILDINTNSLEFGDIGVKAYRPYQTDDFGRDKAFKWFTGLRANEHIQGLEFLPDSGKLLFITSSLKDVCTLYEIGINAIAPNNESSAFDINLMTYLKERWERIIVNYDSDETGVNNSTVLTNTYGIEYWNIPKHYNVKDVSDFVKEYTLENLRDLIMKDIYLY